MKELLRELCTLDGVAGFEDEVRAYIEAKVRPLADEMLVDPIGNLLVFKKGKKRRQKPLMLCAHMDEVGFLVHRITEEGMIKLTPVGGIDPRVLVGRRMRVGPSKIKGVISIKAIHMTTPEERKIAPQLDSLYVDIGASGKAETEKLVSRADMVVFDSEFVEFGDNCVKAKAIDDRVGCAVMIKLLEQPLAYDTWFVFTAGEEIGRGARLAAQRINPGAAMAIEGTTAGDMPDTPKHLQSTRLREGAAVSIADRGTLYDRPLLEKITAAATKAGIRWQYRQSMNGGTDAAHIHLANAGCKAFGLSTPTRYIHCACNVAYLPDIEEVLKLANLFIKETGDLSNV